MLLITDDIKYNKYRYVCHFFHFYKPYIKAEHVTKLTTTPISSSFVML